MCLDLESTKEYLMEFIPGMLNQWKLMALVEGKCVALGDHIRKIISQFPTIILSLLILTNNNNGMLPPLGSNCL